MEADQVICAFNNTRVELNGLVRKELGFEGDPKAGERIICLKNNYAAGIFNGMQGTLSKVYTELATLEAIENRYYRGHYDEGDEVPMLDFQPAYYDYPLVLLDYEPRQFGKEKTLEYERGMSNLFDWANAITCHKAQGDEFDHVAVFEQQCSLWDYARWGYTAASRAKTKVRWICQL